MSSEPICDYCGLSDKLRCKSLSSALECPEYTRDIPFPIEDSKDIEDFGFSFTDETNLKEDYTKEIKEKSNAKVQSEQEKLRKLQKENVLLANKLKQMYTMVNALLTNLSRDPEKEIIKWPNRAEKINEFREKLDSLINKD